MTYKNNDHKKNFNDKKKPFIQQPLGNKVIVIDGNFDFALRKFKKKVQNSGLLDNIKKKNFLKSQQMPERSKKQWQSNVKRKDIHSN